jgi:hypothetical protein
MEYKEHVRRVIHSLALVLGPLALSLIVGCDGCGGPPPDDGDAGPGGTPDAGAPPELTTLAINEVMSKNDTVLADENGEFDDWIELFNLTDADIALDGYTLADAEGVPAPFPDGAVVPARGYLVVFADDSLLPSGPDEPHFPFKLAAEGDLVVLAADDGTVLDRVAIPALGTDVSWGRPTDGASSLEILPFATPGSANDVPEGEGEGEGEGDCFGAPPAVVINEVLVEPSAGAAFVELYNAGSSAVDLKNLVLTDNDVPAGAELEGTILPSQVVPAHGFAVFFADGDVQQAGHLDFALTTSSTTVILGDVCNAQFDEVALEAVGAGVSQGLFPDGEGTFGPRGAPTQGQANIE